MIEVRLSVVVTAAGDEDADRALEQIREAGRSWPYLPVVSVVEVSRELVR